MNLKNNYGVFFNTKRVYKPSANFHFLAFNKKKYYDKNKILHFYLWDTHFKPIDTISKYYDLLQEAKNKQVKYIVQTDFSCWFEFDEQRRQNIKKNFEYYKLANELGFEVLLNFNTIFLDHFEYYKTVLKNDHFGIVLDGNHNEDKYKEKEFLAFSNLLKVTSIKNVFVFTGKKTESIIKQYNLIFELCRKKGIYIYILPTEMVLLRIKKQRFYNKKG